ncbi:hypothetical protein SAMN04487901_10741 [Prevotella communis]|uniref:Uncharacterized protein n=2 Tax=Prevotella TaxID=838 RepID=A0A1H0I2K2_9BACT|nr:hypothetical protein [Prevotella communis]SDG66405.1 hypothetical protein SAMN04487901_10741 [Prevotella communis]SDO25291.1 hypothetical protein SAMN04487900_112112 [Prevotella communis]
MTTEEIKKIVDDEQAEQLTTLICRHWEVATQRLSTLAQEITDGMDTCIEAEIYAALVRMQRATTALLELNATPSALLVSEYLERIEKTVSNASLRQSVITLEQQLSGAEPAKEQESPFFDVVTMMLTQPMTLPTEQQKAARQQFSPTQHIVSALAQHMKPDELLTMLQVVQTTDIDSEIQKMDETTNLVQDMRQVMETLDSRMSESLQMMLLELFILQILPSMTVSMIQQRRTDSKAMAHLFNKVLMRVRESNTWWNYWKEHRETLRVVSDSSSWCDIMTAQRTKERAALGQVPGGLFAKWTTDREAFDEAFLDTHLDDDTLRHFIFHLATLSEIARELDPTSKFGDEQLVMDDLQRVGDAVMEAARQLDNLVDKAWYPHYEAMWQELIQDENIFAHLKVTRKSPHNNLFTARFFCHLVGEMKKSAVFGTHSDGDLAEKLTEKPSVGTFRKNIQEGMGGEAQDIQNIFNAIYQKHNRLAHPMKQLHS